MVYWVFYVLKCTIGPESNIHSCFMIDNCCCDLSSVIDRFQGRGTPALRASDFVLQERVSMTFVCYGISLLMLV